MHQVYLLLGSNLGQKKTTLKKALTLIEKRLGRVLKTSSFYTSAPWGFEAKENFLNIVALLRTGLSCEILLGQLLNIEAELGRKRDSTAYESRTIDIDILLYNDEIIEVPGLQVPHPRMNLRRFALVPLAEIAPQLIHPVENKSIRALLQACGDNHEVTLIETKTKN